jgi:hypothetical protein
MMTAIRTRPRLPELLSVIALSLAAASPARANSHGIFGRSGRTISTCSACHGGVVSTPAAMLVIAPLNPAIPPPEAGLVPGATYVVTAFVTGGPAQVFGFDADASGGEAVLTEPDLTQRSPIRLEEVSQTLAGDRQTSWTWNWIAPSPMPPTVTFWLCVVSGNADGRTAGDGTATWRATFSALPPEVLVRLGDVNRGQGVDGMVDVFSVNGTVGDELRRAHVVTRAALVLALASHPGAPAVIPYVVYAIPRENGAADVTPHPFGLGSGCFPTPLAGGSPVVVANTFGREDLLGRPLARGTPLGPGAIVVVPSVPARGRVFTLQGIVPDAFAPNGRAAFTNAVVVRVDS